MRNRKILCLMVGILSICVTLISGCSEKEKEAEIIWYINDPGYYAAEGEIEPYKEIRSERFELFNERLKELDIQAKVVFKYMPFMETENEQKEIRREEHYKRELEFEGSQIERLLQSDSEADIVAYHPIEYQEFLPLNDYFEKEETQKIKSALPEAIWNANYVGEKIYQIPRGNVSIEETVYMFYKPFLEEYGIELNVEMIREMEPREVITYLLPYFEQEKLLDDKYYLTSADSLQCEKLFIGKQIPMILGYSDPNVVLQTDTRRVYSFLDLPEAQESLELMHWIYENDIDAHIERQKMNGQGVPIFQINNIPSIEELNSGRQKSDWLEIPLGNRRVKASLGNGVLKSSDQKKLAVQVLSASMYDEELSNLMIYGVPEKDYQLENGHVVKEGEWYSNMGSFSQIGNNMIAYPNSAEVKEKREIAKTLLQNTPESSCSTFAPIWKEDIWGKMLDVAQIYSNIMGTVGLEEIPDLNAYIEEQKILLKEAGVEEIVLDLQKQVDCWKE